MHHLPLPLPILAVPHFSFVEHPSLPLPLTALSPPSQLPSSRFSGPPGIFFLLLPPAAAALHACTQRHRPRAWPLAPSTCTTSPASGSSMLPHPTIHPSIRSRQFLKLRRRRSRRRRCLVFQTPRPVFAALAPLISSLLPAALRLSRPPSVCQSLDSCLEPEPTPQSICTPHLCLPALPAYLPHLLGQP